MKKKDLISKKWRNNHETDLNIRTNDVYHSSINCRQFMRNRIFYNFVYGDKYVPTIITNKHIVNNNPIEMVSFTLHLMSAEGEPVENTNITLSTEWHFHSSHDLCFCYINSVLDKVREITGKNIFYIPITDSIIPSVDQLNELSAIEEIVMIGYPIGLWDETNNFPIFRKGYTASHPAFDFNKKGIGLLDIAAFPGSSGSPIFILNENSYSDKKGNIYVGRRVYFLGIQFAVLTYNAKGNIGVENIPTQQVLKSETPLMSAINNPSSSNPPFPMIQLLK